MLVLGVAYKKDIDDLRESPALTIIELLQKDGAVVSYHDPYFPFIGKGKKFHDKREAERAKGDEAEARDAIRASKARSS